MGDYWRGVVNYPNYEVSRRGEVWSLVRSKLLAPVVGTRGYLLVNLYNNGRPKNFLIHRLVAAAFIGTIPPGFQVNHKNGRKRDNDIENLEIVTAEENREHALRTGLMVVGEANPNSRLTDEGVREIRKLRAEGVRVRDIAHQYDVAEKTIYLACRRVTWKHVA